MARWPLLGGAYMAQGIIANCQRCVNLYPERNPVDSPTVVTHYPTPGLLSQLAGYGVGRGLWVASDGTLYGCSGTTLWWWSGTGAVSVLGALPALQSPVKFVDNGVDLMVTDGTSTGAWTVNLSSKAFAVYSDPTGYFEGTTLSAYLDTFTIFNTPGTRRFIVTESSSFAFSSEGQPWAEKTSQPDLLVGPQTVHRELWLVGTKSTEIWTTVADQDFPFQIIPGAFVQYGCIAPQSIATADVSLFWLSQNAQGGGIVVRGKGYAVERVSTHAIEQEIQKYPTLSDAVAYTYQENGHIFYVLTFPSADKTWVYDEATTLWHERAWADSEGKLHRQRVMSAAWAYGKLYGMDWETGEVYHVSSEYYTDDGDRIIRVRSFPHLKEVRQGNAVISLEGKRIKFDKFIADIEVGTMPLTALDAATYSGPELLEYDSEVSYDLLTQVGDEILTQDDLVLMTESGGESTGGLLLASEATDDYGILLADYTDATPGPRLLLRWSNTRGASWQGSLTNTLGAAGQYATQPMWRRLGFARDRVWELSWTAPCKTALNGAWVEMRMMRS